MLLLKIGILSIGNEVVKGRTVNSNSSEISSTLTSNGFDVSYHIACKDDQQEICICLRFLMEKVGAVITTGGLGPTMDDITIESIGKCLGEPVKANDKAMKFLKSKYSSLNLEMTEERLKMAKMPSSADIIENNTGTAPGMFLLFDGILIFSIPGVPREMRSMMPYILDKLGRSEKFYLSREVRVDGIMESTIAHVIREVYEKMNNGVSIKSHPESFELNQPVLIIEFYGYGDSKEDIEEKIKCTYKEMGKRVKDKFNKSI